ncbi:MAG: cysteine--tRNA ligase [Betaproteobacteria bacterium]|nr:MAG: cysteine--tRNA ligase [Betaproteobacteria bacterium]
MLKIYNSLSRAEELFIPIDPPRVRMYVCGMTVYDYCHLGHARVMIVFDTVQRWLRASGYQLTYVRNITDIDDKIIRRAADTGEPVPALTERFIRYMDEDAAALGVQKPDFEPRATRHVAEMLEMITRLEERGIAYRAESGDVNFAVRKFSRYGKLSGKSLEDLRAGERVEVDATKRDPLDFVLWKRAKQGEPFWQSPWGNGRPGWHIECSAMSTKLLGAHFDVHGGGEDLQFPHHENEIAQSEGVLDEKDRQPFVKYWMHNGFVRLQDQKMSKSTGNVATIRELLKRHHPEVVRFFVVRAHYRSPLNYSDGHLEDARHALARLYTALKGSPLDAGPPDWDEAHGRRFREAMDDDFNTPEAVAVLFDLANEVNRARSTALARQLRALGRPLGLLGRESEAFLRAGTGLGDGISDAQIGAMIAERNEARGAKNFRRADEIRDELLRSGIALEDGPQGTTWRRA